MHRARLVVVVTLAASSACGRSTPPVAQPPATALPPGPEHADPTCEDGMVAKAACSEPGKRCRLLSAANESCGHLGFECVSRDAKGYRTDDLAKATTIVWEEDFAYCNPPGP